MCLQEVKVWLSKNFTMKDLGETSYILGMKIYRDRSRRMIGLTQGTYIQKVLKRFSMENSKRGLIPMSHGVSLSKKMSPKTPEEKERMSKIPYTSAIGSIMYVMLCTRSDVAYSISVMSRYQSNPGEVHWKAVKNILKYLRRTQDIFLVFSGESELKIEGYTDSSFQSESDSKSMSGYVFTLNGGAISWKSSKQSTTADSTAEAEYIAASEAAKEAVLMRKFVSELEVVPSVEEPIVLNCDNNAAIAQAKEPRLCKKFAKLMQSRYQMSMMGELSYFLGLQVKQNEGGTFICQSKYTRNLLKKFGMQDCSTASTPMATAIKLDKDTGTSVDITDYRGMIGSLLYLTTSRPDIMYATCRCVRFQADSREPHLTAVKRIFKYLKGIADLELWYPRESDFKLIGYSDADFAGCKIDRKSTSGSCQFLGGRLVSWFSKKQKSISTSTAEAEYIAAGSCCAQILKEICPKSNHV
ncbi:hypothetical protein AgCh_005603 [Apium graveolens]